MTTHFAFFQRIRHENQGQEREEGRKKEWPARAKLLH